MSKAKGAASGAASGAAAGSAFGPWGALVGGVAGLLGGLGGKKEPPKFAGTLNINQTLQDYYGTTSRLLPKAQQVASQINTFDQAEQMRIIEEAMPGIGKIRTQLMS